MIPVSRAAEPDDFGEQVRRPGLRAIQELIGTPDLPSRRGRRRRIVASAPEGIPAGRFPDFWTRALDPLCAAYYRRCAYCALAIERVTGAPTVDHFVPKSSDWQLVYEWSNFRLASARMNNIKGEHRDVIDPFEVQEGWFAIDLIFFQIIPGEDLDEGTGQRVQQTIARLDLGGRDLRCILEEYALRFWKGEISLQYLETRAPLLARELDRQGRLGPQGGALIAPRRG